MKKELIINSEDRLYFPKSYKLRIENDKLIGESKDLIVIANIPSDLKKWLYESKFKKN